MNRPSCAGLPLATFVDDFAGPMKLMGGVASIEPAQAEGERANDAAEGRPRSMVSAERFEYYLRTSRARAVIQTGERRFSGGFNFRKGVIAPESAA